MLRGTIISMPLNLLVLRTFPYLSFPHSTARLNARFGMWASAEVTKQEGSLMKPRKWLHRFRTSVGKTVWQSG